MEGTNVVVNEMVLNFSTNSALKTLLYIQVFLCNSCPRKLQTKRVCVCVRGGGIEPLSFRFVDNLRYLTNHSHPVMAVGSCIQMARVDSRL